jgi:hypothetical protein
MTALKSLSGLCAFAALSTSWCVLAAVEETKTVEGSETKVKFADCPTAVQKTLQQETVGAKLNEVLKATEDDETFYKADVTFDARDYEIVVADDGTLLAKVLSGGDETTIEVKLSDCPAAVQKTLKRESRGSDIETVDKVATDEKTIYVTYGEIEGKPYEIIVAEDGVLISKVLQEKDE